MGGSGPPQGRQRPFVPGGLRRSGGLWTPGVHRLSVLRADDGSLVHSLCNGLRIEGIELTARRAAWPWVLAVEKPPVGPSGGGIGDLAWSHQASGWGVATNLLGTPSGETAWNGAYARRRWISTSWSSCRATFHRGRLPSRTCWRGVPFASSSTDVRETVGVPVRRPPRSGATAIAVPRHESWRTSTRARSSRWECPQPLAGPRSPRRESRVRAGGSKDPCCSSTGAVPDGGRKAKTPRRAARSPAPHVTHRGSPPRRPPWRSRRSSCRVCSTCRRGFGQLTSEASRPGPALNITPWTGLSRSRSGVSPG